MTADYFMGGVSILLGLAILFSAVFNWSFAFQLAKAHWLETKLGRRTVRGVYALIGVALIALGGYIIW